MEKNSLYQLFKKKFKNPSQNEMHWVQPDDMIFEHVLKNLDNENDKTPFAIFRYVSIILLLISIPVLYHVLGDNGESIVEEPTQAVLSMDLQSPYNSQSDHLVSEQASSIEDSNKLLAQSQEDGNVTTNPVRLNNLNNDSYNLEERNNKKNIASINKSNQTRGIVLPIRNSKEEGSNEVACLTPTGLYNSIVDKDDKIETYKLELPLTPIVISTLSNPLSLFDNDINMPVLPLLSELETVEEDKIRSNTIFISGGYSLSTIDHPLGLLSNDMVMSGHDKNRHSWNLSLGYQKRLNDKWSIQAFASYNHINMESLTTSSFNYDDNNEFLIDDVNMYQTELDLITPTTGYAESVEFDVSGLNMDNQDILDNRLNINQGISIVSTNLGINYHLFEANKFDLSIGLSSGLDVIVRNQETMNIALMTEGQMLFNKNKAWVNHEGLNRLGINIGMNVRANWNLSDKYALFINPSFRRSLTSIRSVDLLEERSYLNILQISTGVSYKF